MWLVLVVLGFVVVSNLLSAGAGFERVDSSQMFDALDEGNIRSAKVIGSDQHEVQLTLDDGERIQAQTIRRQRARQPLCSPSVSPRRRKRREALIRDTWPKKSRRSIRTA
jgi:hypothetical protein